MMTNWSDRGSAKPRGSQRFENYEVIKEPMCGLNQGQQPYGAARTGRTHGCTRPVLIAKQKLLRPGVVHTWTYNDRIMPQLCWCRSRPCLNVSGNATLV